MLPALVPPGMMMTSQSHSQSQRPSETSHLMMTSPPSTLGPVLQYQHYQEQLLMTCLMMSLTAPLPASLLEHYQELPESYSDQKSS